EAYMIALASELGRDGAHDLLYRAVRESRERDEPLLATMRDSIAPEIWQGVAAHLPEPADYVGSTAAICERAVAAGRSREAEGQDWDVASTIAELAAMQRIRSFEERVREMSLAGQVIGSVHLTIGQEAIPVGACAELQPQDAVFATYRGHGWALARGVPP